MSRTDRDSAPTDRGDRADWWGPGLFVLVLLVTSVMPVSWIVAGGNGGGFGAGPLGIGLTDPFHLVGYAVLTVLVSRAIGRRRRGLLLAAVVSIAVGFGIELVQAPIPWRSFAWRDAAVNTLGAVGAATLVRANVAIRGEKDADRNGEPP